MPIYATTDLPLTLSLAIGPVLQILIIALVYAAAQHGLTNDQSNLWLDQKDHRVNDCMLVADSLASSRCPLSFTCASACLLKRVHSVIDPAVGRIVNTWPAFEQSLRHCNLI